MKKTEQKMPPILMEGSLNPDCTETPITAFSEVTFKETYFWADYFQFWATCFVSEKSPKINTFSANFMKISQNEVPQHDSKA